MTDIPITLLRSEYGIQVKRSTVVRDWSESMVIRLYCTRRGKPMVKYMKRSGHRDDPEISIYAFGRRNPGFPIVHSRELKIGDDLWILMDEAPGTLLADIEADASGSAYLQAAKALAKFHSESMSSGWHDDFQNLRLSRSWAETLPKSVMGTLKGKADIGEYGELNSSLLAEVNELADGFWREQAASFFDFPFSLIHGDSHYGNLFLEPGGGICLIDWSTAAVAPGLLDVVSLWDVAHRMGEQIPSENELLEAYLEIVPGSIADAYGEPSDSWRICRCFRAFMELEWFCSTEYDFGARAQRELNILHRELSDV